MFQGRGRGGGGGGFQMGVFFKWKVTSWAGIGFDGGIFEKNQRMGEGAPPTPPPPASYQFNCRFLSEINF